MKTTNNTRFFLLLIITFICISVPSYGQRTSDGQLVGTVAIGSNFTSVVSDGEISFGRYFLYSEVSGGVLASNMSMSVSNGETLGFLRLEGFGKWMWRAYGTYARNFNCYIGGDLFLGAELMDPFARVSEVTYNAFKYSGYNEVVFIYGLGPRAELEFFPFSRIAFFASFRAPLTFGSQYSDIVISASARIGAKYNF